MTASPGAVAAGALLLIATTLPSAQRLSDGPTVPGFSGEWNGFFQDRANSAHQGPATLAIDSQNGRRLTGLVTLADRMMAIGGTIAPDLMLSLTGRESDGEIALEGRHQRWGAGSLAEFTYRLSDRRMGLQEGVLLVARDFGAGSAPAVDGRWRGEYASNLDRTTGPASLAVAAQAPNSSRFAGQVSFRNKPPFNCAGTIRTDGQLLLVGLSGSGRLFARGQYDARARRAVIEYHTLFIDGSIDFGRWTFDRL